MHATNRTKPILSQTKQHQLLHGDCLEHLLTLAPDSVDLVCTDPPYGIGFMGRDWDTFKGTKQDRAQSARAGQGFGKFIEMTGRQLLRVMKPGAFLFMTMTPRQDCLARAIVGLENAGFKIGFTSLYWTFASGFPKAANISQAAGKRNGEKRKPTGMGIADGGLFTGAYGGYQPKPAVEIILVAMKPLSERTFLDQALKNGKGVTWLDACRIPVAEECVPRLNKPYLRRSGESFGGTQDKRLGTVTGDACSGRFPANLLISNSALDNRAGRKGPDCRINNFRSYSRFFDLDAWAETLPFLIVPKASKREKNNGLEKFAPVRYADRKKADGPGGSNPRNRTNAAKQNHHPTVKPLKLMAYLITLGSRPGDVVLDPFLGSGTTAVAAKLLGRRFIGIEQDKEYVAIARARLAAAQAPA